MKNGPINPYLSELGQISLRDAFAIAALSSILADEKLGFIFRSSSGGPPRWNGYALGQHGETHVEAQKVAAELAYEAADAMLYERAK